MDRRYFTFLAVAFVVLVANAQLALWLRGPQPKPKPKSPAEMAAKNPAVPPTIAKDVEKADAEQPPAAGDPPPQAAGPAIVVAQAPTPIEFVTLGSVDPASPFRMLVTLTSQGAAVERIELSSPKYRDIERESGYLGHLAVEPVKDGCRIRLLGAGTPAARAGLHAGDVITAVNGQKVSDVAGLEQALRATRPRQSVEISAVRDGKAKSFRAELTRHPLEVVRPEHDDPLSFLMTLDELDGKKLATSEAKLLPPVDDKDALKKYQATVPAQLELDGIDLRKGNWEVVSKTTSEVVFRKLLADSGLEIVKRYRLEQSTDPLKAYHLDLDLTVTNRGTAKHTLAYRLDGPTGLPTEGHWYATKISPDWGAAGLRDAAFGVLNGSSVVASLDRNSKIVDNSLDSMKDREVAYAGVDAQYFAAALLPKSDPDSGVAFATATSLRVGAVPTKAADRKLTNVSVRLVSPVTGLDPGKSLTGRFQIFAGPKAPEILSAYGLDGLRLFGWFGWVAKPMTAILHFFHDHLPINYGIAIVMLTAIVRLGMFPISRQQNVNAQKMQALQPEMKRISEKYKNDAAEKARALQEFQRKHNFNPLAGCLPAFVQLPIFIGLYRSLSVDVQLRDAPLFSERFSWATNLSAPDMLFRWDSWLPEFVEGYLGPYFNVFPMITIGLFLWQQKMFMPPPTDEQSRMQAKVMQYMMVFMGVMFFKVASGLCLYFIVSTLWGILERKFMPKPAMAGNTNVSVGNARPSSETSMATANGSQSGGNRIRQKGRR